MLDKTDAQRMARDQMAQRPIHRCLAHNLAYSGSNCPLCIGEGRVIARFTFDNPNPEETKDHG